MLKIKLQRVGRKHDPSFRVVVTDRRTGPKSNKHAAILGHYDAIRKSVKLKVDEIKEWIAKGAKPTDTVHNILVKEGVIEGKKKNVLPKKTPIINEEEAATDDAGTDRESAESSDSEATEEVNEKSEEKTEEVEEGEGGKKED